MEKLRYKCLILDHDDTVVDSTKSIHYPVFVETMKILRPELKMSLSEYFKMNCNPGFFKFVKDVLRLTDEELAFEFKSWQDFVKEHVPKVYDGMRKVILKQKELGGYVCVASHSMSESIYRDYEANHLPRPDLVFGKDLPDECIKPAPYAIEQILKTYKDLQRKDLIMVDDLKMGYQMAKSCGVDFGAACWAHSVSEIREFMKDNATYCFEKPEDFYQTIFEKEKTVITNK